MIGWAMVAMMGATVGAVSRPNVLILLTDDVGWGDVGYNCKNSSVCPQTPNIDAVALSESAVLFHRFYSGSGVCSPTRASVLTGRNNKRGCINSALPCDHMASGAAECSQGPGLSWNEFTIAHAASKAGIPSIHLGKWHLGDLWDKKLGGKGRWPAGIPHHSNPADHGFTEWDSSQSQLPTSTPNCGCFPAGVPPAEQPPSLNRSSAGLKFKHTYPGDNCVIGGGVLVNESFVCSTYWHPDNSTKTGVAPALSKIVGDDGDYMVKGLSTFIDTSLAKSKNFLATLWLHYIHLPHPAMPEYYDMYENDPDYVGALGQMDATFGDIVGMLQTKGVYNNTLLFFTSDNGCHCIESTALWPEVHCGGVGIGRSSAGLRGCKASNWEGGIRVPGFMVWPDRISQHVQTSFPAVTHDFLPTILEAYGVAPDDPQRPLDGISLLSFVGDGPQPLRRDKPIGFWWGDSVAWIDNDIKLVGGGISPGQGCSLEPPYTASSQGPYLYNLTSDPTESVDLRTSAPALYASMLAALSAWTRNVSASAALNGCPAPAPPGPTPPAPPPGPVGTNCTFEQGICGFGSDDHQIADVSLQGCCDACRTHPTCTVAVFEEGKRGTTTEGTCHIKIETKSGRDCAGYWTCRARNVTRMGLGGGV